MKIFSHMKKILIVKIRHEHVIYKTLIFKTIWITALNVKTFELLMNKLETMLGISFVHTAINLFII